jgi:hypothetical protein
VLLLAAMVALVAAQVGAGQVPSRAVQATRRQHRHHKATMAATLAPVALLRAAAAAQTRQALMGQHLQVQPVLAVTVLPRPFLAAALLMLVAAVEQEFMPLPEQIFRAHLAVLAVAVLAALKRSEQMAQPIQAVAVVVGRITTQSRD